MTKPFRFGIQLTKPSEGRTWADTARKLEDDGWSTLVMPDHFEDQLAVTPALAAAAQATTTLRLGALVFGNDYRHPVVLAKDMATLDVLSEGRMEFGLGAGWMKSDYDKAGMEYDRPGVRIDRMLESLAVIRGLFADGPVNFSGDYYQITDMEGWPKPVQTPPPVLIGAGGKRMLGIAAREADIVAVTANLKAGYVGSETTQDVSPERFDQKMAWVKEAAGDRYDDLEFSVLVFSTQVTDDRAAAVTGMAELFHFEEKQIEETPALLIGSTNQIIEQLQANRERWGFNYIVVQDTAIDTLGPVVAQLTGT
ncbi:MAG TPA: TIGR03621 family F420-dependent LLM class oxidoreductase [Acidimicrobiia bacterium]|jgi:probable F420-dependent oxidoreductase|nr:TIGR03621 family F420-dependent LLM class oxidoreductase [Acidimicrobiia bacterium]HIL45932.1 TIGR03621 family F420-dependent LLM class oxidoreductase [Acidimicrobiia bacterium]